MTTAGIVFLALIALASITQTALLLVVTLGALRTARRVEQLQERVDRDLRPTLDSVNRISRNVAEISDLAALQARRVDRFLAGTVEKVDDAAGRLRDAAFRPLGVFAGLFALGRAIRRGASVYRDLGSFDARQRGTSRRYVEDEHLFI